MWIWALRGSRHFEPMSYSVWLHWPHRGELIIVSLAAWGRIWICLSACGSRHLTTATGTSPSQDVTLLPEQSLEKSHIFAQKVKAHLKPTPERHRSTLQARASVHEDARECILSIIVPYCSSVDFAARMSARSAVCEPGLIRAQACPESYCPKASFCLPAGILSSQTIPWRQAGRARADVPSSAAKVAEGMHRVPLALLSPVWAPTPCKACLPLPCLASLMESFLSFFLVRE